MAFKFAPVARRLAPVFWRKSCIAFFVGVLLVSSFRSVAPLLKLAFDRFSTKLGILKWLEVAGLGPSSFDGREIWKEVRNFILCPAQGLERTKIWKEDERRLYNTYWYIERKLRYDA